jgi:GT2 family glycosyltransferase
MRPIDLHLISWNRPKMTELVIKTIIRNTKPTSYRLVVLDNGSSPETVEMLKLMYDNGKIDRLVLNTDNVGLERARQDLFLNETLSEFFICVDNDCLPPPMVDGQDWVERLVELMNKYEDYAAISMRTQVMIGTGNIFEEADLASDEIVNFPHPGGSYRIMRTKAVQNVGGWDRGDPGRGSEERYICGKLRDFGYKTAFAVKIACLHLFGTRGNNTTDRWGYDKDMRPEDTGHSDISHPALTNGDDFEEILKYAGGDDAKRYYQE